MKNSELIKELKEFNPDAEVTTPYSETIELSYISNEEYSKKTTPIVFIEGADEKYLECENEYINEYEDVVWCNHYDKPCTNKEECDYFNEFTE